MKYPRCIDIFKTIEDSRQEMVNLLGELIAIPAIASEYRVIYYIHMGKLDEKCGGVRNSADLLSKSCLASLGHITGGYQASCLRHSAQMPPIDYYHAKLFLIAYRHFRYPSAVRRHCHSSKKRKEK